MDNFSRIKFAACASSTGQSWSFKYGYIMFTTRPNFLKDTAHPAYHRLWSDWTKWCATHSWSVSVGCQVNLANKEPSPGFNVYTQFNNVTKGWLLFVVSCPKIVIFMTLPPYTKWYSAFTCAVKQSVTIIAFYLKCVNDEFEYSGVVLKQQDGYGFFC